MELFNYENFWTKWYRDFPDGSGVGSFPGNTEEYRKWLADFFAKNNVKSVIDFGCGDWQFSKLIDWSGINYLGMDVVSPLIDWLTFRYGKKNIQFIKVGNFNYLLSSCSADVLILKDVLQHWSNAEVCYFLDHVRNYYKYIIICNASHQAFDWQEEPLRSRPLSANFFPLKIYHPKIELVYVLKFEDDLKEEKEVSVIYYNN